jgi:hypothetical protein
MLFLTHSIFNTAPMNKTASFLMLFMAGVYTGYTQKCTLYVPNKVGAVIETTSYDKKGKETGTNTLTIKAITNVAEGTQFLVENISKQKKSEEVPPTEYTFLCKGDRFVMDMKQFVPKEQVQSYKDAKIEATDLDYPATMQVGQSLTDGRITVSLTQEGMPIPMVTSVDILNRKVTGREDVVTRAGSFNCYKIEYDVAIKMMFKINFKVTEWVAESVGSVKSETRDTNGKLSGSTLLTRLVN